MTQAHIFFTGTVQGVGFRFTTQRIAIKFGLTGWVKNLSDGRVEALVEGEKEKIEDLLDEITNHFNGKIRDKQINFGPADGKFKEFSITF